MIQSQCDQHKVPLELYDDGDGESGPQVPTWECPRCRSEAENMECETCGRHSKILRRRTIHYNFDATEAYVLDCGHVNV
jgi:hypothetical protein